MMIPVISPCSTGLSFTEIWVWVCSRVMFLPAATGICFQPKSSQAHRQTGELVEHLAA